MVIFIIVPTFDVFRMSMYRWSGFSADKEFVGFGNFQKLAEDMKFVHSFQNTVLLLVIVTVIVLPLAVIFAGLLSQYSIKGKSFLRFVMYIPNVLSIVVIAAIFSAVYDQSQGLVNGFLKAVNLGWLQHAWLGEPKIVIYSIAFAMIWQSVGYYMVMYMSSMAAVNPELYEAASLDGASKSRQLFTITIPLIWQNIRTTLTFFIISSINLSFVLVRAMTSGGPNGSSQVLLGYMYDQAYTNSTYGYGMAIGAVIFVFSFVLSLVVSMVTKRETVEF